MTQTLGSRANFETLPALGRSPISVVIPCFQCSNTIERAIASIVAQTLLPTEIILVDDASNDDTRSVLKYLKNKFDSGWIKLVFLNENAGVGSARNAGWAIATQPYIAFLDSDDSWHPEKLRIQYEYMRDNPGVAVCGHQCIFFEDGMSLTKAADHWRVTTISAHSLLFRNAFSTPTVMLKSGVPLRFQEERRFAEDIFLWQSMAFLGLEVVRIETILAFVHKPLYGASGLSAQLWNMEQGELSNFTSLLKNNSIGLFMFFLATSFSCAKFIRRLILIKFIGIYKKAPTKA